MLTLMVEEFVATETSTGASLSSVFNFSNSKPIFGFLDDVGDFGGLGLVGAFISPSFSFFTGVALGVGV